MSKDKRISELEAFVDQQKKINESLLHDVEELINYNERLKTVISGFIDSELEEKEIEIVLPEGV